VRTLKVRHGLKVLLPHGVLLIPNQEKRHRHGCYSGETILTQGGESDMGNHRDDGVELTADDGP
jgi:hypothetical protein